MRVTKNKSLFLLLMVSILIGVFFFQYYFASKSSPSVAVEINPDTPVIKFLDREYGPFVTKFDEHTKVRSVYFPLKGQETGLADEEIILNLYIHEVWSSEAFTVSDLMAQMVDNSEKDGLNIKYRFEAPDPLNNEQAFFLVADSLNEEENSRYVFFIKIGSIGKNVYSVLFSKKLIGHGSDLQNEILKWEAENIMTYGDAISNLGPDESWIGFLGEKE